MTRHTTITVDEDVLVVTTNGLTAAEMGAHVRLLLSASFHGGSLQFEPDRLARVVVAVDGEWPAIWQHIQELWSIEAGVIRPRTPVIIARKARRP